MKPCFSANETTQQSYLCDLIFAGPGTGQQKKLCRSTRKITILAILTIGLSPLLPGCHWAASGQNAQGARLSSQGQYTAALQQFQKAIDSDPANADGYYNLAATTHRLAVQRNDQNLIDQSESLYNQCLDHNANHVECHRGLAVLLVDTGRPQEAFSLLKGWAAKNPMYSEPRIELARLYEESGKAEVAQKYLEDAVQQDANNPRTWRALARLRENKGESVQALQNYQRAYALDPSQPAVADRIALLSRQINSSRDAQLSAPMGPSGGTTIARPMPLNTQRY